VIRRAKQHKKEKMKIKQTKKIKNWHNMRKIRNQIRLSRSSFVGFWTLLVVFYEREKDEILQFRPTQ